MYPPRKKPAISRISTIHYAKLLFRSILFLTATIFYLTNTLPKMTFYLILIWLCFSIEMILRFFPSNLESMGCQKQFAKNYKPTNKQAKLTSWKSTLIVFIAWFVLNLVIGILYFMNIFDAGILFLISLAYSVCDMICILFFCPFQTWFMKNRCCVTCRIYNWDFAMMFTPFLFIPSFYTWSLLLISLLLLGYWELMVRRHPERFMEQTNACLSCKNCEEKLCVHKTQLKKFWKKR